jgi:hypothetical protein
MTQRSLNLGMRLLLGLLGAISLGASSIVGATETRIAALAWPYWPAIAAAAFCALVACGGFILLRRLVG